LGDLVDMGTIRGQLVWVEALGDRAMLGLRVGSLVVRAGDGGSNGDYWWRFVS
jgi:hypothetical protein